MVRTLAIMSEKGGSGKTTTAVNLSVALAKLGKRVLLIDSDPQGNATLVMLKGEPPDIPNLYHVLMQEADAAEAIRKTGTPRLDVVPAATELADANVELASEPGRERRLIMAMRDIQAYDLVIVDTPPQRTIVNFNVLNYVSEVLVTVDPGVFSLAGLAKLQAAVGQAARALDNRALRISGLVLTQVQANNLCRDIEQELRSSFGTLVHKTVIPASVKIGEATARFKSVLDWAARSPGALAYRALAKEVLKNATSKRSGHGSDRGVSVDDTDGAGRERRAG